MTHDQSDGDRVVVAQPAYGRWNYAVNLTNISTRLNCVSLHNGVVTLGGSVKLAEPPNDVLIDKLMGATASDSYDNGMFYDVSLVSWLPLSYHLVDYFWLMHSPNTLRINHFSFVFRLSSFGCVLYWLQSIVIDNALLKVSHSADTD